MDEVQTPHATKGKLCPFHKVDVSRVCHKCPLWVKVVGRNPQTDAQVDQWACSFTWLPILLIENAQQSRQTGAAVESFRNEMVKSNMATLQVIANRAQQMAHNALDGPEATTRS